MTAVLLLLAVVASAGQGHFAPNEILVKFRTPPTEAGEAASTSSQTDRKSLRSQDLQTLQGRVRIRGMNRLVSDRGSRQFSLHQAEGSSDRGSSDRQRDRFRGRARVDQVLTNPGFDRIYRIELDADAGVSPEEILAAYRNRADVEFAEFNPIISICAVPDDPGYGREWSFATIQAPLAWDTCHGSDVVVALIDTGVDYNHRDLQGNLWVNDAELNGVPGVDDDGNGYVDDIHGYNFAYNNSDPMDDHGHGTHCAGIVAAVGDNDLDVAGICWSARIMPIKILDADGEGTTADAVPAIYYAVANGADIISGSWGGEDGSEAMREAIEYAHQRGVIVVAAAGNAGSNAEYYPAGYPEVLAVAATDSSDQRWYLSNYGDWVDIAAPGRSIVSLLAGASQTAIGPAVTTKSGTSMAAPHVSGACALLLSANPWLTTDEVRQIVMTTGDPIASGICSSNARLNVYKALRAAIPSQGIVRLDRKRYGRDTHVGILVADWDLRGAGSQAVLVAAGSGDQETVVLSESQDSLGVFLGDIVLAQAAAVSSDGILQAQHGQSFVVRYLDADDGQSHAGQWALATATVDYKPPAILNVQTEVRGTAATIALLTDGPVRTEIRYGKTSGGPYELVARESLLVESPSIELSGLSSQTTYYFVVAVTDEAGNETLADNAGQGYAFVTSGQQETRVPADYATIQEAIDEAVDGDTIWVADGTYSGLGNLEIDFQGKAITVRSENGPENCIVDCKKQGRAFYFNGGETADSVLDGFTITNGGNTDYGAGIRCMGSSPTIRNCAFVKNTAEFYGGGLCNDYGSDPTVVDCTFRENSCSGSSFIGQGGGMANRQGSNPIVSNCAFIDNTATYTAGALGNFDAASPRVTRCAFRGNHVSGDGGAVVNGQDCLAVFKECVFFGNDAAGNGGAASNTFNSGPSFENCTFSGNTAGGSGGTMDNYGVVATLANCTIAGNTAGRSCGGVRSGSLSDVQFDNCILWDNADGRNGPEAELAQLVSEYSNVRVNYCDVQGWSDTLGGIGNFDLDPLFADPAGGDYHLRSQGNRWDSEQGQWVSDSVTSPCIDAGNPGYPLGNEPQTAPNDPNATTVVNARINMGAFGGTAEASIAPPGWNLTADTDNDGLVDWRDLARMAANWMHTSERCETDLDRDGLVGTKDLARLALEWRHVSGRTGASSSDTVE